MTEVPRIIGISGFMRTGKDSVAALLQEFGYTRVSFADPLRKMALDIDPTISLWNTQGTIVRGAFSKKFVDHWQGGVLDPPLCVTYAELVAAVGYETAKNEVPDFRRFLQHLGTEGVRNNFGQDAWVNLAIKAIVELPTDAKVVMPDVRFPNEAEAVHEMGGVVWRTERPGYEGGPHPSEAEVLNIEPDLVLRASALLDEWEELPSDEWEGLPSGVSELHRGLGSLVLEAIEKLGDPKAIGLLPGWAGAILANA